MKAEPSGGALSSGSRVFTKQGPAFALEGAFSYSTGWRVNLPSALGETFSPFSKAVHGTNFSEEMIWNKSSKACTNPWRLSTIALPLSPQYCPSCTVP